MSTRLSVQLDASQLNRIAREIDNTIHRGIAAGVAGAVKIGVESAKLGGFKDRTGDLRLKIYGKLEGWKGDWFWGLVKSPQKYTSYVELGTRPHEIWPKAAHEMVGPVRSGQTRRAAGRGPHEHIVGRGIALRWKDASGVEHFARFVRHPGTIGFHFMKYAELVMKSEIEKTIQASIRSV